MEWAVLHIDFAKWVTPIDEEASRRPQCSRNVVECPLFQFRVPAIHGSYAYREGNIKWQIVGFQFEFFNGNLAQAQAPSPDFRRACPAGLVNCAR